MKKRFLAVFLALALCLGLMPAPAFAADSEFVIKDGVLTQYNGSGGDVVIPDGVTGIGRSAFKGCTGLTGVTIPGSVTSIGMSAFDGCTGLTSVTIPNGVTSIGGSAFRDCDNLTGVTIPSSVTSIDGWAFFRCGGLTSVTIPNGVTSIGDYAFYECGSLTSVTIPPSVTSIGKYVFTLTPWLKAQEEQGDWFIVNGLLVAYQGSGGNVVIPSGVTRIGGCAFFNCDGLTGVTIPDSVTSIGDCAFQFCGNLTSVTIPSGVTRIEERTFDGCRGLTSVTLGSRVSYIAPYAFSDCTSLTGINVPAGATVEKYAFYNTSKELEMLEGKEADGKLTGAGMFALLPSERPAIAPEAADAVRHWTVTEYDQIDAQTAEATAQEMVALAERLTSGKKTETEKARAIFDWVSENISYDYTAYQDDLAHILHGATLTEEQDRRIGQASHACYTFYNRRGTCGGYAGLANRMLTLAGLRTAYITGKASASDPVGHAWSAVYADGQWMLFDATWGEWDMSPNFHDITEKISWTDGFFRMEILQNGRVGCGLVKSYAHPAHVTIPSSVNAIADSAFAYCADLTGVTIPDNVTAIGNGAFRGCTGLTNIDLPNSVTDIGPHAFGGCTGLTSIDIPKGVTSIGMWAFQGCTGLTGLTIPEGVTELGQYMFSGCTALTSITIPKGVTAIGSSAFKGCTSLTSVTIPGGVVSLEGHAFENCTALTSVTIGDGVTGIEAGMFWGCSSLTSASIPASVTSVGQAAFYQCPNVTDVYYGGGEEQWNTIQIGMFNSPLARGSTTRANIHYNTVGGFGDVNTGAYYADAVKWAVANGVTNGTGAAAFSPSQSCTHAQILTFLWRAAGEPESSAQPPIAMKGNEFYCKAVKWAAEKGMVDKSFNPGAPCTRAYAVLYIWQAFGQPAPSKASPFTDVPAHWASAPAAAWAAEKGITTGTTATTFNPGGICNRGQIVTFLYRAYK